MRILTQVGHDILTEGRHKNSEVYRGILRILSGFGYASIEEVMYGFDLALQEAINRLAYLERSGFINRFASRVKPESFFCLTPLGRQAVSAYRINDTVFEFHPSKYRLTLQNHDRMIVKTYLALKKILKEDLQGWISEHQLRQESGSTTQRGLRRRILDGEFHLTVHKETYAQAIDSNLLKLVKEEQDTWRCGLELELTLKSVSRYEKQFVDLSHAVYSSFENHQHIPLILFLYGSRGIYERLVPFITSPQYTFGNCVFLFGEVDRFMAESDQAPLMKFVGRESRIIPAREMNRIKYRVS